MRKVITRDEFCALIKRHGGDLAYMVPSRLYWPHADYVPYISYRGGTPMFVTWEEEIPMTPDNWAWAVTKCNQSMLAEMLKGKA